MLYFYFLKYFIYLIKIKDVRESGAVGWGESEGEGEADSSLSKDPAARFNPRTPGSRPEPKKDV